MNHVSTNIRFLRLQRNLSRQEVANLLNISIPSFAKIESGVTNVTLSRLEQISALFDLSVVQLLTLNEPEQTDPPELVFNLLIKKLYHREAQLAELKKAVLVLYEEIRESKS